MPTNQEDKPVAIVTAKPALAIPAAMALPMTPLAPVTMATGFSAWFVGILEIVYLNHRELLTVPSVRGNLCQQHLGVVHE